MYRIKGSHLTNEDRILAYKTFLLPQVLYVAPCLQIDPETLQRVHRPALEVALNAIRINRTYPQAVAFAGPEYYGLDLTDYAASQGTAQMKMYVSHIRRGDRTGDLMLIEKTMLKC